MASVCPKGGAPNVRKRMIKELLTGRDLAIQLKSLLYDLEPSGAFKADEILGKILRSFSQSISAMSSGEDAISGDSGESNTRPSSKEGRGCYKRRRGSQSWTAVSSSTEDGHAWRKYGQKEILNSKFPRSYFRCTHKHDQGCKATKHVQKMEDNPNMYRTTYVGQHTCTEISRAPQMIPDPDSSGYDDIPVAHKPQDHFPINPFPCVKDERKEDSGSDLTDCVSGFDQAWPDFPMWSYSDDGFRSFSDASFMDRCINFDGDFQFAGSELSQDEKPLLPACNLA